MAIENLSTNNSTSGVLIDEALQTTTTRWLVVALLAQLSGNLDTILRIWNNSVLI